MRATSAAGRLLVALICGVVPLACQGAPNDGEPVGSAEQEVTYCAAGATVKGVDVSVYQGAVNWTAVKEAGIGFAIARVADGTYKDTKFDANWPAIKAAGLVRGAYQFFEPGEDPGAQADIMISKVGTLGPGDLPCTADVEVTGGQSVATIAAHLRTWVDKVAAGTGKQPMIYVGKYFWQDNVNSSTFSNDPLWLAAWVSGCPNTPNGWSKWTFWQYSDSGHVNGIPATVDLDEFDGSLAQLQAFAGMQAQPDWGAKYVSQSFPLASSPLVMTVNSTAGGYIELENIGTKTWDGNTRLGTTEPRDRASVFAGSDWVSAGRPAAVSGTVAPGASYKFNFNLHAPAATGTYYEHFGVLQEGVHWFSDSGEAGPPDDQLEIQIQVIEAPYHGEVVSQTLPAAGAEPLTATVGVAVEGSVDLKNVGTETWKAGETKLAPTPRDEDSPLAGPTWLSTTRVSTLEADVAPGDTGHFTIEIVPAVPGDLTATFTLVEEGVTWFGDAPQGGGPGDDGITVHLLVTGPTGTPPVIDAGAGEGGRGAGGGSEGGAGGSNEGGSGAGDITDGKGCACRAGPGEASSRGGEGALLAFGALAATFAFRARRRAS